MAEITQLLRQARTGDASPRDALFAAAYPLPETLDVTERTVQRLWLKAKVMMRAAME